MKKSNIYKLIISSSSLVGFLWVYIIYAINISIISQAVVELDGVSLVIIIILIRIAILLGSTIYMYYKWFRQEEQYISDIPFLFATFFLLLTFGKSIDLFFDLTFTYFSEALNLFVIKVRFFIIIFTVFSLIFLSLKMILYWFSLKNKFKKLKDEDYQNKANLAILGIIIIIESIAIIITPDTDTISVVLPAVVIPSLIVIIWLFAFAHKNKRLSQVNSFVLMIGFGLYLISQIIRPILLQIFGEVATYLNIAEIIDLVIFAVIFIGFYLEANYVSV
ncbi:MAG: hypothetical protein ACFFCI_17245 [Promethearchaeota archaeon]